MIILAGPVGSGKSEQGQRLAKRLGYPWVSSGQLLRDQADEAHREVMKKGGLVSDKYLLSLLSDHLKSLQVDEKELVLDGTPRTLEQAKWLLKKIRAGEINLTAIIRFKISEAEIMKRLLARGREDDRPEVIKHRLDEYKNNTERALQYLASQGLKIDEIKGEASPDKVEASIQQILEVK